MARGTPQREAGPVSEVTAIMRNVRIGHYDGDEPVLWFDAFVSEGTVALQVVAWPEAYNVLKQVYDVRDLEGKPCWVEVDQPRHSIKFLRLWKTP